MKAVFIIICLSLFSSAMADSGWYRGSVVLRNREVLVGEIQYTPAYDAVFIRNDGHVQAYNSNQIRSFYFFDAAEGVNRKFMSIDRTAEGKPSVIMEVVIVGKVGVLRAVHCPMKNAMPAARDYDYYILTNHRLLALCRFRSKLYPSLCASPGFRDSIRRKRLNPNENGDAIRIIAYYNSWTASAPAVALN